MLRILNTMETWKEFEANELTHSAAHHLLAIHEVGAAYGGWARVSDIARQLDITRGSVSINLRALKKRRWIETDEHHMVKLSKKGLKAVQSLIAKRMVVKAFLSDILGTPDPQAEIDSCKIEHLISHATGQRLVHFMRFLTSEDPAATAFLERFRTVHGQCPESRTCDVCKGHCLVDELASAI
jgi:DtxR family Mn-dependent transcriptional regulator